MYELGGPVVTGEVLDNEGYIEAVYDKLGIASSLGAYLDGQPGTEDEKDITILLAEFSMSLADAATTQGDIDVATVRFGMDHLTRNMNELCSSRFGYEPPRTLTEALLLKLGMITPVTKRYVRKLDDRYWAKQFPEEYAGQKLVNRLPDETDRQYLARHIRTSIHGLIFAPFTYMR